MKERDVAVKALEDLQAKASGKAAHRKVKELKQDAEFVEDSNDAVIAFVVPQADQVTTLQSAS